MLRCFGPHNLAKAVFRIFVGSPKRMTLEVEVLNPCRVFAMTALYRDSRLVSERKSSCIVGMLR
jgi:hypothetical protein